jgi:hypothetical protein
MFDETEFENIGDFCIDLKEYGFTLSSGGQKTEYFLREMTGQQRDDYLTALNKMMGGQAAAGGKVTVSKIQSFDGIEAELLCRVIFDGPMGKKESKAVKKAVIQSWPAPVQHKLFLKAQKLTGLGDDKQDEKDEEEAKND